MTAVTGGRLRREVGAYFAGRVGMQVTTLIAASIYLRRLSPDEFGGVELVLVAVSGAHVLTYGLMSPGALPLGADREPAGAARLWGTTLVCSLAGQLILAAVMVLGAEAISGSFDGKAPASAVRVGALCLPLFLCQQIVFDVLAARRRPGRYVVAALAGTLTASVASVWLVVVLDADAVGVLLAGALGYGVSAAVGAKGVVPAMARPARAELRALVRYGLPMFPATVALWSLGLSDRLVLAWAQRSSEELGEYAVANRVAALLLLLVSALGAAWGPSILEAARVGHGSNLLGEGLVAGVGAVGLVGAALSVIAGPVVRVFAGVEFADAAQMVPWLTLGLTGLAASTVLQGALLVAKRPGVLGAAGVTSAVVNVGLSVVLVREAGAVGAAIATAASYWFHAALVGVGAGRSFPLEVPWARLAAAGGGSMLTIALALVCQRSDGAASAVVPWVGLLVALLLVLSSIDRSVLRPSGFLRTKGLP